VTLGRYCTLGMSLALSQNPELGRVAYATLTGVTYTTGYDDDVHYSFCDKVTKEKVSETWFFDESGRLAGIKVGT